MLPIDYSGFNLTKDYFLDRMPSQIEDGEANPAPNPHRKINQLKNCQY